MKHPNPDEFIEYLYNYFKNRQDEYFLKALKHNDKFYHGIHNTSALIVAMINIYKTERKQVSDEITS